ncbi:MAG: choice-of-anchor J domain-containing protein, partial [Dokdonella sp.]
MTTRFTAALVVALIFSASASPAAASNPYGSRAGGTSDSTPARANPPAHDVALGPTTPTVSSLNEGFDNITTLVGNGWSLQNNSAPRGTTDWTQGPSVGGGGPFDAFDGAVNAYISTNYNNVGSSGTISNWMLTPELSFGAGATLTFYTRKVAPDAYADRLEVRLSSNGASTNVGSTATTLGDFTTLALSINPNLVLGVYPTIWTQYTITGLPHSGNGRLAFRYYVTSAGSSGSNSDFIGIDRVVYNTGAPEYQVGGNVAGLAGSGLLLRLNGSIDLPIGA